LPYSLADFRRDACEKTVADAMPEDHRFGEKARHARNLGNIHISFLFIFPGSSSIGEFGGYP